jgi:hypothetical protein
MLSLDSKKTKNLEVDNNPHYKRAIKLQQVYDELMNTAKSLQKTKCPIEAKNLSSNLFNFDKTYFSLLKEEQAYFKNVMGIDCRLILKFIKKGNIQNDTQVIKSLLKIGDYAKIEFLQEYMLRFPKLLKRIGLSRY